MRYIFLFTVLLSFAGPASQAQSFQPGAAADIYGNLAQLNRLTHVLYVAAHPDDENTRLLAWLEGKKHVPVTYLSLTRGDGGQNILGSEQGPALGLIRTQELLAARNIDGARQAFTRAIDFGYSKTSQETLQNWDSLRILYDMVWVIRKLRPDMMICRFPPTAEAGHGHHSSSAILARIAYHMAGDPRAFPDQPFEAWKPYRLLFNGFRFGNRNTTREDDFQMEIGDFLPHKGMGSGELAGISRSIHRSQGAGTPSVAGKQVEYFRVWEGPALNEDLFDGLELSWARAGAPEISAMIDSLLEEFDFRDPAKSLPGLIQLRAKIRAEAKGYWKDQKLEDLDRLILQASGLMALAYYDRPEVQAGQQIPVHFEFVARSAHPLSLISLEWMGRKEILNQKLGMDSLVKWTRNLELPSDLPPTQPYWLQSPPQDPFHYTIPRKEWIGLPETPSPLGLKLNLTVLGDSFTLHLPLSFKTLDPVFGDKIEPLRLTPDYTLNFRNEILWFHPGDSLETEIILRAHQPLKKGRLVIHQDGRILTEREDLHLDSGRDSLIRIRISPHPAGPTGGTAQLEAYLEAGSKRYTLSQYLISYDHIPTQQYFRPASQKCIPIYWNSAVKRIAYIPGAGDQSAEILSGTGLIVDHLKGDQITLANLKAYDAVLTGVRLLNTEAQAGLWISELLQYVKEGGTLVMQYNTNRPLQTEVLGPYPFRLSRERVTEEKAKVEWIYPQHPLLRFPNALDEADFDHWVQERGLYFADQWDSRYQTLFRMHDQGEAPLEGSLLYTPYGKGQYIYTGLSFFRQLPAGHTGAIRLLINLLSAGKNPYIHEQ